MREEDAGRGRSKHISKHVADEFMVSSFNSHQTGSFPVCSMLVGPSEGGDPLISMWLKQPDPG